MRRRGENVSAYEVEKVVDAYPDVLESAAFGVPSPVGEQDIMISVVPVDGPRSTAEDLARFLRERLPRFAVPSYLDVVGELPEDGDSSRDQGRPQEARRDRATVRLEPLLAN